MEFIILGKIYFKGTRLVLKLHLLRITHLLQNVFPKLYRTIEIIEKRQLDYNIIVDLLCSMIYLLTGFEDNIRLNLNCCLGPFGCSDGLTKNILAKEPVNKCCIFHSPAFTSNADFIIGQLFVIIKLSPKW